jgi:hypothetical protein
VDVDVAAAEGTFFRRATRDGNGEPVVSARLPLIRHGDGETAEQTVDGAGAGERGGLADDYVDEMAGKGSRFLDSVPVRAV